MSFNIKGVDISNNNDIQSLQTLKDNNVEYIYLKATEGQTFKDKVSPGRYTQAKELGLNSAKKLNDILHQKGIQYKVNGTWVLYSDYSDLGYTSIKQKDFPKRVVYDRKWTGKGRAFILDLLEKEKKQNQNGKEETK